MIQAVIGLMYAIMEIAVFIALFVTVLSEAWKAVKEAIGWGK